MTPQKPCNLILQMDGEYPSSTSVTEAMRDSSNLPSVRTDACTMRTPFLWGTFAGGSPMTKRINSLLRWSLGLRTKLFPNGKRKNDLMGHRWKKFHYFFWTESTYGWIRTSSLLTSGNEPNSSWKGHFQFELRNPALLEHGFTNSARWSNRSNGPQVPGASRLTNVGNRCSISVGDDVENLRPDHR